MATLGLALRRVAGRLIRLSDVGRRARRCGLAGLLLPRRDLDLLSGALARGLSGLADHGPVRPAHELGPRRAPARTVRLHEVAPQLFVAPDLLRILSGDPLKQHRTERDPRGLANRLTPGAERVVRLRRVGRVVELVRVGLIINLQEVRFKNTRKGGPYYY